MGERTYKSQYADYTIQVSIRGLEIKKYHTHLKIQSLNIQT